MQGNESRGGLLFEPAFRLTILLPQRYNPDDPEAPGEPIEPDKVRQFEEELRRHFGGFSLSPVTGHWASGSQVFVDALWSYAVVYHIEAELQAFAKRVYPDLKSAFRQRDIFVTLEELRVGREAGS